MMSPPTIAPGTDVSPRRTNELYVFAQSEDRLAKERAMRRRQLKWLWARLGKLAAMNVSREEMLMKLGERRVLESADRVALGQCHARRTERRADLLPQSQKTANAGDGGGAISCAPI